MIPNLSAATVAQSDFDPLFGDRQAPAERNTPQELDMFLLFAHGPGAKVLEHLVQKYIAAPAFVAGRDPSFGYERNGECNVVRYLCTMLQRAQDDVQNRR